MPQSRNHVLLLSQSRRAAFDVHRLETRVECARERPEKNYRAISLRHHYVWFAKDVLASVGLASKARSPYCWTVQLNVCLVALQRNAVYPLRESWNETFQRTWPLNTIDK